MVTSLLKSYTPSPRPLTLNGISAEAAEAAVNLGAILSDRIGLDILQVQVHGIFHGIACYGVGVRNITPTMENRVKK